MQAESLTGSALKLGDLKVNTSLRGIHLFIQQILSAYRVLDSVLGIQNIAVNRLICYNRQYNRQYSRRNYC